ncbi:MAG TPA: hypothetical protein VGO90_03245, partial [Chthoniobacteraceae bacterium]|nr:hypothetical protein [Chthoniobacteraceae bacterium]
MPTQQPRASGYGTTLAGNGDIQQSLAIGGTLAPGGGVGLMKTQNLSFWAPPSNWLWSLRH